MAVFTIPTDVSQKATLGVLNCYTTQIDLAIVGREGGGGVFVYRGSGNETMGQTEGLN